VIGPAGQVAHSRDHGIRTERIDRALPNAHATVR
jgi:hypothetical protein